MSPSTFSHRDHLYCQDKLDINQWIFTHKNINSKVISVPCFDIFEKQSDNYRREILGENTFKVSIEASSQSGWKNIVGKNGVTLGMTTFGKSGPYKEVYKLFNLTSNEVVKIVSKNV